MKGAVQLSQEPSELVGKRVSVRARLAVVGQLAVGNGAPGGPCHTLIRGCAALRPERKLLHCPEPDFVPQECSQADCSKADWL